VDGGALTGLEIRNAEPADHARVVAVLDEWWGGRRMRDMLPRLFFVHFRETTFVAEREGDLAGFLAGFLSQTLADEAYVHFVGVHPAERGSGLGRELYERFFACARARGRTRVSCVTSPANQGSLAFHARLGFEASEPLPGYDGPGEHRVVLTRTLSAAPGPGARGAGP
jgi:predicted GNAT superfamily acetyltransferase